MIISQFVVNGNARQCEIACAFGISLVNVNRALRRYRERGAAGFYAPRRGRRGPGVLTPEVIEKLQGLLDGGMGRAAAGKKVELRLAAARER